MYGALFYSSLAGDLRQALMLLTTMQHFSSGVGLILGQDWGLSNLAASPFGTDPPWPRSALSIGSPAWRQPVY